MPELLKTQQPLTKLPFSFFYPLKHEINLQIPKHRISIITIVEPTGVPAIIEIKMPEAAPITENTQEKIVTCLKLLNTSIEEIAGKMIRAEIKREPTRFMARTMIMAITVAITTFKRRVFVPLAKANSSSKVMAKIRL